MKFIKKVFKCTGGEIVNEFLMITGYLTGCHGQDYPIDKRTAKLNPLWMKCRL